MIDRVAGASPDRVVDKVKAKLSLLKERDIDHSISLIFGLPHQGLACFQEDVAWCEQNTRARLEAFPLMLLRGTPLHTRKHELGLVEATQHEVEHPLIDRIQAFIPHVVETPSMSRSDWHAMASIASNLRKLHVPL